MAEVCSTLPPHVQLLPIASSLEESFLSVITKQWPPTRTFSADFSIERLSTACTVYTYVFLVGSLLSVVGWGGESLSVVFTFCISRS